MSACLSVKPSVSLSVCLSVCLSICPSACLSVKPSVFLSVCLSSRWSVRLSVCLSISPSACLSSRRSVCLSACQAVGLSVCLSVYLSVPLPVCLSSRRSVCLSICLWVVNVTPRPPLPPEKARYPLYRKLMRFHGVVLIYGQRTLLFLYVKLGYAVSQLVDALRYKPAGRGFIYLPLPAALWPWV